MVDEEGFWLGSCGRHKRRSGIDSIGFPELDETRLQSTYCHNASLCRLMRCKLRLSDQATCWEVGLRCGAGDEGLELELEAVEGRALSLLGRSRSEDLERSEALEESEKETLWPGDKRLPSDVFGLCQRVGLDMIALAAGVGIAGHQTRLRQIAQ